MSRKIMLFQRSARLAAALAIYACFAFCAKQVDAATITAGTGQLGPTPSVLALNSGHFFPGSNTKDWWRYSGVTGARFFISPSEIEFSDDVAPVGDSVTSATSFLNRREQIRTNQFGTDSSGKAYVDWSKFGDRYENNDLYPNNHIRVNYALGELRKLGVEICAQITASQSRLPISATNDWPNMWELWQHYYAQAFYMARYHNVQRFQMYNEPNHSSANGLTITNFIIRLQLASDAVQCAVADVNRLYGKSLVPRMLAPVTAGSAESSFTDWGEAVVNHRHINFLGQTDPGFSLIHVYDYHQYGSAPSSFGSSLASLHSLLNAAMAPEPRYPTAISEFNTRTGANFDTVPDTLDYPTEYSRFGAVCVNLMANGCDELYCFKFSQTESSGPNYPVQKNALHYVDNDTSPYNIGGITRAGEVWRLFNKAFRAGRTRLSTTKDSGAANLDVHASFDADAQRYSLFCANNTTTPVNLDLSLATWGIPTNNLVLLEEVSEARYGSVRLWTNVGPSRTISTAMNSNSVWLLTASLATQAPEQIINCLDDAEVRDGGNKTLNYGTTASLSARNDPLSTANRSVGLLKFQLPATNNMALLQHALLSIRACSSANALAQALVFGIDTNNWTEGSVTWSTAPNLRDNVAAGKRITNSIVEGAGAGSYVQGQLVTDSTNTSELLLDVTEFIRSRTNGIASFLVAQEPRWNNALPSLQDGDSQPAGIKVVSKEGASGSDTPPRLRLVFSAPTNPPTAIPDSYTTLRNSSLNVPAPGVLANDLSADGSPLTAVMQGQATNGAVTLGVDGAFTYSPSPAFAGLDAFSYAAVGSLTSAPVFVSIHVQPSTLVTTDVKAFAEAFVRGGIYASTNPDEAGTNYLMVKYHTTLDTSRKTYFQFDLAGKSPEPGSAASLQVGFAASYKQSVQLWGLKQAWTSFNGDITWNGAQANDVGSNDMLTSGPAYASRIGAPVYIPTSGTSPYVFTVTNLDSFVFEDRATFAITGVSDAANDSGGLRMQRTNTVLTFSAVVPAPASPPQVTGIVQSPAGFVLTFQGTPGALYVVQAATNLFMPSWESVATNTAGTDGTWSFTDDSDLPARFYRSIAP